MNDKKNGFQKLDEFIEIHNAKRRKYLPFLIAFIIGIAMYTSFNSRASVLGIGATGILTYRLIKYIIN